MAALKAAEVRLAAAAPVVSFKIIIPLILRGIVIVYLKIVKGGRVCPNSLIIKITANIFPP